MNKLLLINLIVIAIVIWLVGVSVKDFACLLVGQYDYIGAEKQSIFNNTMQYYLIRASIIAVGVAFLIYYLLMKRVLRPIHQLTKSAKQLAIGEYPEPLPASVLDEAGQLSVHFNQLTDSLKRSEQSRKQLLADLSHEIRTPLSNLNGYLEALSNGVLQGSPELYQSLHEESKHLTRLVEQMEQLSRWEQKQQKQYKPMGKTDMAELIDACCKGFELEMKQKGLECCIDAASCLVEIDATGIKQALNNLIQNAVRYNTSDWIQIRGGIVWETMSDNAGKQPYYLVEAANEGQHIPDSKIPYIFDRMVRSDEARQREAGGAGLGLSILKEIVRAHDGDCGLEVLASEKLYTFWFKLPLTK